MPTAAPDQTTTLLPGERLVGGKPWIFDLDARNAHLKSIGQGYKAHPTQPGGVCREDLPAPLFGQSALHMRGAA